VASMLQIVLIRPGSTDYDQQQRIQGTLDVPLNAQGNVEVVQATDQLAALGIEVVYTSPSEAASQTAGVVAKHLGVKLKVLERLENLDHGLWQGMLVEDVRRKQPKVYRQWQEQPENVRPPEGEMLSEAEERIRIDLNKLLKRHREGVIALVAPEPLASLIRRYIHQDELGDLWKLVNIHGGWEVLEIEPVNVLAQST